MAGDGNGRPHGRIFFIVLGCLTFLASLAMIFASMALSFLGASFADAPGARAPDSSGLMLGGFACLVLAALMFRLAQRDR